MTTTEKLQNASIAVLLVTVCVLCAIIAMKSDEINKLNLSKTELQSKLNIKNEEIEVANRDLEEAHERAGVLFLESMVVTDSYNELKKQCKKCTHYSCGTQPDSFGWEKCGWDWECKSFFEDHFEPKGDA